MRHVHKLAMLGTVGLGLCAGSSYGAFYQYDWTGGAPGYTGALVLDASASPVGGGSISDIVSLEVTTPINGTIVADLNPIDGNVSLADPVFTWNSSQITEMGIIAFDPASDYLIAAQNFSGTGLNQLSGELASTAYDEVDTGGSWEAVPVVAVPESTWTTKSAGFAALIMLGMIMLRRKRCEA